MPLFKHSDRKSSTLISPIFMQFERMVTKPLDVPPAIAPVVPRIPTLVTFYKPGLFSALIEDAPAANPAPAPPAAAPHTIAVPRPSSRGRSLIALSTTFCAPESALPDAALIAT